jgi:hypothetical protein
MKPAIFIDAFLTDDTRHHIFNHNVSNFIKHGWDVFIISNKINDFNQFSGVKYFEYDSTNRILPNRHRYELSSDLFYNMTLYDGYGNPLYFRARDTSHGFTNWTLLYNNRKIAEVMKRFGHTHFIRCEYDIVFKNYDLMNTMFSDFGKTEQSLNCMVHPFASGFGCRTYTYLMSIDNILNTIPVLNTEDDYEQFLIKTYGRSVSPVYEKLIEDLFVKYVGGVPTGAHFITDEQWDSAILQSSSCFSEGDTGNTRRSYIGHKPTVICPVNNNTKLFMWNYGSKEVFIEYTTGNPAKTNVFLLNPHSWLTVDVSHSVTVYTSEMKSRDDAYFYDLVNPNWSGTATFGPE